MDEIKDCILQTFGELKTKLTETDLEKIMNTKMITTNRAEELVKQQVVGDMEEDEDYKKVTSLFSRTDTTSGTGASSAEVTTEVSEQEARNRCQTLRGVDKLSSTLSVSSVPGE